MAESEAQEKKRKIDIDSVFSYFLTKRDKVHALNQALHVLKLGLHLNLASLYIEDCNARSNVSFSSATITTTPIRWENEREPQGIAFGEIFETGIDVLEEYLDKDSPIVPEDVDQQLALKKLLTFLLNREHEPIFEQQDTESRWAILVAQHLLSPLAVDNSYTAFAASSAKVDEMQAKCPCTQKDDLLGRLGDTSFGCKNGWHGSADIIMEEDLPAFVAPGDASEVPSTVEKAYESDAGLLDVDEIKVHADFMRNDIMRVQAGTIVFSFLQRQLQKGVLGNTLIPGVGISGRSLLFTFYDSLYDVLLTSRAVPLFDQKSVDISSVLALWLTLNYKHFCTGVTERMKKYTADFYRRVDNHLEEYSKNVEKPVHLQHKTTEDLFPFVKLGRRYERRSNRQEREINGLPVLSYYPVS